MGKAVKMFKLTNDALETRLKHPLVGNKKLIPRIPEIMKLASPQTVSDGEEQKHEENANVKSAEQMLAIFDMLDADGDGMVTREEIKAYKAGIASGRFATS